MVAMLLGVGLSLVLLMGVLLIVGTRLRWSVFVDPPEKSALFSTFSFIGRHFGADFLIGLNYFLGGATVLVSIFLLVKLLTGSLTIPR